MANKYALMPTYTSEQFKHISFYIFLSKRVPILASLAFISLLNRKREIEKEREKVENFPRRKRLILHILLCIYKSYYHHFYPAFTLSSLSLSLLCILWSVFEEKQSFNLKIWNRAFIHHGKQNMDISSSPSGHTLLYE